MTDFPPCEVAMTVKHNDVCATDLSNKCGILKSQIESGLGEVGRKSISVILGVPHP